MEEKKVVVHVTSSLACGGAEAVLFSLVTYLEKSGRYKNYVISFRDGPYRQEYERYTIPVFICTRGFFRYSPLLVVRLVRLVQKINPVFIHATLWAANLISRIVAWWCKKECINVIHNRAVLEGKIRLCADYLTLIFPAHYVAVSHDIAHDFSLRYPVIKKKCTVIVNGCDYTQPVYHQEKKSYNDLFVIGSVGRFESIKNYDLLIRAYAGLTRAIREQAIVMLVGYGSQEATLRALAADYGCGSQVLFKTGSAHDYYPFFDVFVQPSLSEGLSMALLEAMGYGIMPVVSWPSSRHPVVTDGYDGAIIPVNDEQSCTQILQYLFYDRNCVKDRGLKARTTVHMRFSSARMYACYEDLFGLIVP